MVLAERGFYRGACTSHTGSSLASVALSPCRADGIVDYLPSPFNGGPTVGSNLHYTARAGASIPLGAYPPNQDSIRGDSLQRGAQPRADTPTRCGLLGWSGAAFKRRLRGAERVHADSQVCTSRTEQEHDWYGI